jgi:hypothetical protein
MTDDRKGVGGHEYDKDAAKIRRRTDLAERKREAILGLLRSELSKLAGMIHTLYDQREPSTMEEVWEQFDLVAELRHDIEHDRKDRGG